MFPFPPAASAVAVISQSDAVVISAICVALPATIAACVGAYNAWRASRETRPNGGSSMRDAIDRIGQDVRELRDDVRNLRADQRDDHKRIQLLEDKD